jgi:hypothetical protein
MGFFDILAHVFLTEAAALAAIQLINEGEGIPVESTDTTTSYTAAYPFEGGWYFQADAVTQKYLTETQTISLYMHVPTA